MAWWTPWSTQHGADLEAEEVDRVIRGCDGATRRFAMTSCLAFVWVWPGLPNVLHSTLVGVWCAEAASAHCTCETWVIPFVWVLLSTWPFLMSHLIRACVDRMD